MCQLKPSWCFLHIPSGTCPVLSVHANRPSTLLFCFSVTTQCSQSTQPSTLISLVLFCFGAWLLSALSEHETIWVSSMLFCSSMQLLDDLSMCTYQPRLPWYMTACCTWCTTTQTGPVLFCLSVHLPTWVQPSALSISQTGSAQCFINTRWWSHHPGKWTQGNKHPPTPGGNYTQMAWLLPLSLQACPLLPNSI